MHRLAAIAVALLTGAAWADQGGEAGAAVRPEVREALRASLLVQAAGPRKPPSLPLPALQERQRRELREKDKDGDRDRDQDRDRDDRPDHKTGLERAAEVQADSHASEVSEAARADAAVRAAQGSAASIAKSANADSHAAAGLQRANQAGAGGKGKGHGPPPHPQPAPVK